MFQKKWLDDFDWLIYCTTRNKAYCFICSKAVKRNMVNFSTKGCDVFLIQEQNSGFDNWQKAIERFKKHEISNFHHESVEKLSNKSSVYQKLNDSHKKANELQYKGLLKTISSLKYLAKQGLPIRGHDDLEGNLRQLLELRMEDCPEMQDYLAKNKYLSHDIINEILNLMDGKRIKYAIIDRNTKKKIFFYHS